MHMDLHIVKGNQYQLVKVKKNSLINGRKQGRVRGKYYIDIEYDKSKLQCYYCKRFWLLHVVGTSKEIEAINMLRLQGLLLVEMKWKCYVMNLRCSSEGSTKYLVSIFRL